MEEAIGIAGAHSRPNTLVAEQIVQVPVELGRERAIEQFEEDAKCHF